MESFCCGAPGLKIFIIKCIQNSIKCHSRWDRLTGVARISSYFSNKLTKHSTSELPFLCTCSVTESTPAASSSLRVLNETAESHYFQVWKPCRRAPTKPWISSVTPAKDRPLKGCSRQPATENIVDTNLMFLHRSCRLSTVKNVTCHLQMSLDVVTETFVSLRPVETELWGPHLRPVSHSELKTTLKLRIWTQHMLWLNPS